MKELLNKIKREFKSKNCIRYIIVFFVFVITIWYVDFAEKMDAERALIQAQKKKEVSNKSDITELQADLNFLEDNDVDALFVLSDSKNTKEYKNILNSNGGDFYRLVFRSSLKEESFSVDRSDLEGDAGEVFDTIKNDSFKISLKSRLGLIREVGIFNIGEIDGQYQEVVFFTDSQYQDVLIEKEKEKEEDAWDEKEIVFDKFFVSRLDVKNDPQARQLSDTVFGENEKVEFIADRYPFNEQVNDKFSKEDQVIKQYFKGENRRMTYLDMTLDKVGTGGEGDYRIKIISIDDNTGDRETIKKISFSARDMEVLRQEDDFYRFGLIVDLQVGKTYLIEMNNEKVSTDKYNYLALENISESEDWSSYFKIVSKSSTLVGRANEPILENSFIQDMGGYFLYSYDASANSSEILSIYDYQGDLNFDKKSKMIVADLEKDNYISYKINTAYPFENLNFSGVLYSSKEAIFDLEYSFDGNGWRDVLEDIQISGKESFNFTLNRDELLLEKKKDEDDEKNGEKGRNNSEISENIVYLRVFCEEEPLSEGHFSFNELSVNAVLKK